MALQARRPPERLKLTVRLLPPGLTESEFKSFIGSEWHVGSGKVDWMDFSPGKTTKNPAKHSKPSVAWLRVANKSHITLLEDHIRQTIFTDAKNTINDPVLPGPPVLEFAMSQKIPSNRKRTDTRVGTIDQDPDFRIFLESLTNPIQKPAFDIENSLNKEGTKITTTPLIEHIREKKAAKEGKSASKASKDARDIGKNKRKGKDTSLLSTSSLEKSKKAAKGDRAAKQAVKVLTRQANTVASSNSTSQTSEKSAATPASPVPSSERRRERAGPFNIVAKIQRDLGLGPSAPRRGPRGKGPAEIATSTEAEASTSKEKSSSETRRPSNASTNEPPRRERPARDRRGNRANATDKDSTQPPKPPIQPTILKKPAPAESSIQPTPSQPKAPAPSTAPSAPTQPSSSTSITPAAHKLRVFLKHANPSQGITEPLLQTALATFGPIRTVEIDKRKGIAHADFQDQAGLAAAIKAGKIDVAQGAVHILPFRERSASSAAGPKQIESGGRGRGGHRGGRGPRGRGGGGSIKVVAASEG